MLVEESELLLLLVDWYLLERADRREVSCRHDEMMLDDDSWMVHLTIIGRYM